MGVVNLNKARKAKTRKAKRAKAEENSAKFGRSKTVKAAEALQETRDVTRLDGHKREP